jgi:hypothetical protein
MNMKFPGVPTPKSLRPRNKDEEKEKEDFSQGYDVYIREKGKYFKANKVPKNYAAAFNFGAEVVDNSAAATFKIKKSKGKAKIKDDFLDPFLKNKFREPKSKKKDKFIEKNTYRIDTAGELRGITAKGLLAQRVNRKKDLLGLKI